MRLAGNMGFIVICGGTGGGAMFLDERDGLLYFHREVTVFRDRRKAARAVEATINNRPSFQKEFGPLSVLPLKPAHGDGNYRIEVDQRQGVIVNVRSESR